MGEHLPCKQGVRGSNPLISIRCICSDSTIKTEYREDAYYIEVCNKLDRKTSKYICTDMRTKKI